MEKIIINYTTVSFDEKLKNLIKRLRLELDYELQVLQNSSFEDFKDMEETQNTIRRYFSEHMLEFNNTRKTLNKPDYFALLVCVITDIDNKKTFQEVFDEFKSRVSYDMIVTNEDDERYIDDKTYCACGQGVHCEHTYLLTNTTSMCSLLIGCECVKKRKILDKEQMKQARQRKKEYMNRKAKHCEKWKNIVIKCVNLHKQQIEKENQCKKECLIRELNNYEKWKNIVTKCVNLNNVVYNAIREHHWNNIRVNIHVKNYLEQIVKNEIIKVHIPSYYSH
jgi:hypothetical protein